MNDVNDASPRTGNIVIGATLVLTGIAVMLDRAGVLQWRNQWTLWPLILGGIGLARFVQTPPGAPKQGLLFMAAAVWLLLGESGAISMAESWPVAIIALGLIVALNGGVGRQYQPEADRCGGPMDAAHLRRMRRRRGSLSPIGVIGIWIAVLVALQVSGARSFNNANTDNRLRVISVMSRSEHISRAGAFEGADITTVMGKAEIDLRNATIASGTSPTVHVWTTMGNVVVRVPPGWRVDTAAVSALGKVEDVRPRPAEAEPTSAPSPRLVLRGVIAFGRLEITS